MARYRGYGTTPNITAKRQIIDMSEEITMLNASENPFTLILKKIGKQKCHNVKFEWMQDYLLDRSVLNNGAILAADTDIVMDDTTIFKPQDIIRFVIAGGNNLSDLMLVKTIDDATNTLTVVRAISALNGEGGQVAVDIADDSRCVVLGNAFEEGGLSAAILNAQENSFYNYTQNFKTSFGVSGRADSTKLYGGKLMDWERKKKGIEHMQNIELSMLFGERSKFTDNSSVNTTMQGLWGFITNDSHGGVTTPGTLDEAEWDLFISKLFTDNLSEGKYVKTVFCGSKVLDAVNGFAKDYRRITPDSKTWGLDITQYLTPYGTVNLIYHPKVFNMTAFQNFAIGVDFKSLKYRFLEGRDTKLKTNIQANDMDAQKDQYETDCGLQVVAPEVNCKLIIDI